MDEAYLTRFAKAFLLAHYQQDLTIPIQRNNRLRTTQGRYVTKRDGTPIRIDIAGHTLDYGTQEVVEGIVKHECIHFALHQQGKPYKDGNALFEAELKKHNAPSTKTILVGKIYLFTCDQCGKTGESRLKQLMKTPEKYRTACCRSTLTITGEKIYDGTKQRTDEHIT